MKMKMGMGLNRGGGQVFTPAQRENLLQSLDGVFRGVGNFDGDNYLTVPIAQEITADYQCFYKGTVLPEAPHGAEEALYGIVSDNAFLKVNASGKLEWRKNTTSTAIHPGNLILNQANFIELYFKTGSIKIILNGVPFEKSLTWLLTSWNQIALGSRIGGSLFYTGLMWDVTLCNDQGQEEFWSLNNTLTGSLGTVAIATDPNNSIFDIAWQYDRTDRGNYALLDTTNGTINLNPNPTTVDGIVLASRGILNVYSTLIFLAGKYLINTTYITLNDGQRFICYNYLNGTTLLAPENDKMNIRVRR